MTLQDVPEAEGMPAVNVSASSKDGVALVTFTNLDLENPAEVAIELRGGCAVKACARTLTSEVMDEHNTFDEPDRLTPQNLDVQLVQEGNAQFVKAVLPAKSVTSIELTLA